MIYTGEKKRDPKSVEEKTLDLQLKRTLHLKIDASKTIQLPFWGVKRPTFPGIGRFPFVSGSV